MSGFDPAAAVRTLGRGGGEYLDVKNRLLWLRTVDPDATIETEHIELTDRSAIFRASIRLTAGGSATGYGSETASDFGDFIEKAETKAIGRALGALGFGTQFALELDDDRKGLADAPIRADVPALAQRRPAGRPDAPRCEPDPRPNPVEQARARHAANDYERPATQRQIRFVEAIGREAGLTVAGLIQRFGPLERLTVRTAAEAIDALQAMRAGAEPVTDRMTPRDREDAPRIDARTGFVHPPEPVDLDAERAERMARDRDPEPPAPTPINRPAAPGDRTDDGGIDAGRAIWITDQLTRKGLADAERTLKLYVVARGWGDVGPRGGLPSRNSLRASWFEQARRRLANDPDELLAEISDAARAVAATLSSPE